MSLLAWLNVTSNLASGVGLVVSLCQPRTLSFAAFAEAIVHG
jgi:hypothetical protein